MQCVNAEPYASTEGKLLLLLELFFVFLVGFDLGNILFSAYTSARKMALMAWLTHIWNYLDLLNAVLFTYSLCLRGIYVYQAYSSPTPLPSPDYPEQLERLHTLQSQQTSVNSINGLICLFVIFKYYDFQDRMKIMADTIKNSWVNLYHFILVVSTFIDCMVELC